MAKKIYTKTGDDGTTALFRGGRALKSSLRVSAYGDVDELNSSVGLARSQSAGTEIDDVLNDVQKLLFTLGAELTTPANVTGRPEPVTENDVNWMEQQIDRSESQLATLKSFILPCGCPLAAALHVARTVCRRAERSVVALRRAEPETNAFCGVVLNRLSDLLFSLARLANLNAGVADVEWHPRR